MSTEYFHLDKAVSPSIIGAQYPQCKGLTRGYDEDAEHSFYQFAHHKGERVDYIPNLDGIVLYKSAKMTDVISCSRGPGNDLIISKKFHNLLKDFKAGPVQYFDCFVYRNDVRYEYVWVHYVYDLEKNVDYTESIFDHPDKKMMPYIKAIKSYDEFINFYKLRDEFGLVRADSIVLNTEPMDFFAIGRYNQKTHISVALKKAITEENITGVEINNGDNILFKNEI